MKTLFPLLTLLVVGFSASAMASESGRTTALFNRGNHCVETRAESGIETRDVLREASRIDGNLTSRTFEGMSEATRESLFELDLNLESERDLLGALPLKEGGYILPCAFAESGRFGAICPDAGVYMMIDSGVVLCQLPFAHMSIDPPAAKIQPEPKNTSGRLLDGNGAAGMVRRVAQNTLIEIEPAALPRTFERQVRILADLYSAPAVPPA